MTAHCSFCASSSCVCLAVNFWFVFEIDVCCLAAVCSNLVSLSSTFPFPPSFTFIISFFNSRLFFAITTIAIIAIAPIPIAAPTLFQKISLA
jgi:hypothetical protein